MTLSTSSADLGIGYSKVFADNLHTSVIYTNGSGYKKGENDTYKKLSAQVYFGEKKVTKKDGFNVGSVFTFEPYDYEVDSVTTEEKVKTLYGVFGVYAKNGIRVGGELERFNTAGPNIYQQMIVVYGNFNLNEKLEVFGRFDIYDPDTDTEKDGENYAIVGVGYKPGKGLVIVPNLRLIMPEDGDKTTLFKLNFMFEF
ncbi:MAG: hypothetical protein IIA61_05665 [Candidatus Marinimicrobia bacterium]|nr:hypothetical protein [Candidatus Neomarinimicrobiota bacterium]